MNDLDQVIVQTYISWNTPADEILVDPTRALDFAATVAASFPTLELDAKRAMRRLLQLRKRGEQNGGLPRLRP